MRILFVADGRSPIALNWISYFLDRGDEVHLVSTFECIPSEKFVSANIVPVAFSQLKKTDKTVANRTKNSGMIWGSSLVRIRTSVRRILSPLSIPRAARQLKEIIAELNPDIVHALRIPFEGILAAKAMQNDNEIPLVISVWGNDFTLHAPASRQLTRLTRFTLKQADALHTDCYRDQPLAQEWGFDPAKPAIVSYSMPSPRGVM